MPKKTRLSTIGFIVPGLLLIICLTGCQTAANLFNRETAVGTLWDVFVDDDYQANWDSADTVAQEQYQGLISSGADFEFQAITASEGNRQDDVQVAVRDMVENEEIQALIGGTSNQATTRAASLVNFFNVPMIVPTAGGDNLLPSNNLWAFRLSAPGSAYASYLFDVLLLDADVNSDPEDPEDEPILNIAILYEQNTFGENAAVATTRAALRQGIRVAVYASFSPDNPDQARLIRLLNEVRDEEVNLVYMVTSDPAVAQRLTAVLKDGFGTVAPVMVGQAGGFASLDYLKSQEAEGVYVLRQKIDPQDCPTDLKSLYAGQTYAAFFLLDQALRTVRDSQRQPKWYEFYKTTIDDLETTREKIRDTLKQTDQNIPCVGQVAFDNLGHLKSPQFELITIQDGEMYIDPHEDFITDVKIEALLRHRD